MPEISIAAEVRTEFGKGAARRVRRADKIPAVVYGHGTDPQHIALPGHDLMLALKHANVLLEVEVDGTKQLTLPKSVQRDPVRHSIEHVDLVIVSRNERVTVEVPLIVTGTPASGGVIDQALTTITVEAAATNIPTGIAIDLEKAEPGTAVHARDLEVPEGTSILLEPDALVVHVLGPQAEPEPEETAEAAAEDETEAADSEDSAQE